MRVSALSTVKGISMSAAIVFTLLIMGTSQGQSIDITSHTNGEVITIFTPFGLVPPTKIIDVEANTTGAVQNIHFGLNGGISGDDWSNGATGSAGTEEPINSDMYTTNLDLTEAPLIGNAMNPLTLHAFATAAGASGYAQTNTNYLDFDASDSVPIVLDIQAATGSDADSNGIPDADQISNITPFAGLIYDLQFQPDPIGSPNYYVERRVESLEDGNAPSGVTFHTKSFVVDFQIYTITIGLPNMAWFKTNRISDPDIAGALNMVVMTRAEQNPDFILDNHSTASNSDTLFTTFPNVDPPADFTTQFGADAEAPTIYFNITVLVEVSSGVWRELNLSSSAPMFVTISSVGLNGHTDLNLYRYPTTTIQSTDEPRDIFQMGDGLPWTLISPSTELEAGFRTTSFQFGEFIQGALYAASSLEPDPVEPPSGGGGGGGGGGCFIATAAYGTPMATEIETLRSFRDRYMMNTPIGASFVDTYYRVSPPIADKVAESALLRTIVLAILAPIVSLTQLIMMAPITILSSLAGLLLMISVHRKVTRTT